ncbi:exodeoxyribonuclease VII small subunit [Haloplasma contractile]|uniref:Exodeoxyribonuclease 7 small subunit n=1 Tax=Haloplasma contractile SSD-17B TaxID=1033810 RepID=U2FM16_9MOLU|nr:exodeoxyribonuclease VII small subunit [Haloplasma contractile]ERJ13775.1 Exodeoxyribonuclease 7 small subunit protein [Haloplasma contractile SSD-17B]
MGENNTKQDYSFEQAMTELETIVRKLESGQVNLDDSISLYKKGLELTKFCNNKLTNAEKLIVNTMNNDQNEGA